MSTESSDQELGWAAEKRAFVADYRDDVADERDRTADIRDCIADGREADLEEWERSLNSGGPKLGGPAGESGASTQWGSTWADRSQAAGQDRERAGTERTVVAAEREEAAKRRDAAAPPTRLAQAFAEIAEHLYAAADFDEVLSRIAKTAVLTVAGCEMASVTLREPTGYRTGASTDPAATAVDVAQYESQQGPSLDAVDAVDPSMVYAHSFPDERWPKLASRPTEAGVQSALSFGLRTRSGTAGAGGGSLNSYGAVRSAFSDSAQDIGVVLAAHASMAVRAVGERESLQRLGTDLQQALLSRDVIGQAKGILMERLRITPEVAFDVLRDASQRLNVKLREVAADLAQSGELAMPQTCPPDSQLGHDGLSICARFNSSKDD